MIKIKKNDSIPEFRESMGREDMPKLDDKLQAAPRREFRLTGGTVRIPEHSFFYVCEKKPGRYKKTGEMSV